MKNEKIKFVKKSGVFLIILLILIFAINLFYTRNVQIAKHIFRAEKNFKKYTKNNNSIKYVFLGDSHIANGINPRLIDDSYNFATPGENYIETYFKFKKFIEENKIDIKNIILEIDLNSLQKEKKIGLDKLEYYSDFMSITDLIKLTDKNKIQLWSIANLPLIGNGNDFFYVTSLFRKKRITYLGYIPVNKPFIKQPYKEKINKNLKSNDLVYLFKIIKLAKKNKINVIFIKTPMTKIYDIDLKRNNISRKEYYETMFNEIDNIFPDLRYNVLDYYDLFFKHQEYFFNNNHLNYKGAEVLSQQINIDLNK